MRVFAMWSQPRVSVRGDRTVVDRYSGIPVSSQRSARPVPEEEAGEVLADRLSAVDAPILGTLGALGQPSGAQALEALLAVIAAQHDAGVVTVARTCTTCRFHEAVGNAHPCRLLDLPWRRQTCGWTAPSTSTPPEGASVQSARAIRSRT